MDSPIEAVAIMLALAIAAAGVGALFAVRAKLEEVRSALEALRLAVLPPPAPSPPSGRGGMPPGLSTPARPTAEQMDQARAAYTGRTAIPPPPRSEEDTAPDLPVLPAPPSPSHAKRWEGRLAMLEHDARRAVADRATVVELRDSSGEPIAERVGPPPPSRSVTRWKSLVAMDGLRAGRPVRHCHKRPKCDGADGPCSCDCSDCERLLLLWRQALRETGAEG